MAFETFSFDATDGGPGDWLDVTEVALAAGEVARLRLSEVIGKTVGNVAFRWKVTANAVESLHPCEPCDGIAHCPAIGAADVTLQVQVNHRTEFAVSGIVEGI